MPYVHSQSIISYHIPHHTLLIKYIHNLMSRRKQKTILQSYLQPPTPSHIRQASQSFIPEYPLSNKFQAQNNPDSLQRFQWELQNSLLQKKEQWQNHPNATNNTKRKRAQTQYNEDPDQEEDISGISETKLQKLQKELSQLKGQLMMNRSNGLQKKLDRLLDEMVKNREADRQFFKRNSAVTPQQPPNNIFYPPMPFYPSPYDRPRSRERSEDRSRDKSEYRPKESTQALPRPKRTLKPRDEQDSMLGDKPQSIPPPPSEPKTVKSATIFPKIKKRPTLGKKTNLKKYFYAVLFTKFLKKQASTLARARRVNFRSFFIQKFDMQLASLKDWLKQSQEYALPVILEKQEVDFQFWHERSGDTQRERQDLLLNLVKLGLQKMRKECLAHKITPFSQLLNRLCMRGSFVMSRFWSAYQLRNLCISEFYGCLRADESLEKFLLGLVIFVKLLIFNMILQPHKIDEENFPKSNQKLQTNMYVLGSIYYRLVKQVLKGYLAQKREPYYRLGNWLSVKQEFLVECCEPLRFRVRYPTQGQWISGLLSQEIESLEKRQTWGVLKGKVNDILTLIHKEVKRKRKDAVRGDKHKLYN